MVPPAFHASEKYLGALRRIVQALAPAPIIFRQMAQHELSWFDTQALAG
jgi:hypothetical protein